MPSVVVTVLIVVLLIFAIIVLYILKLNKKFAELEELVASHALAIENQQMSDIQQHDLLKAIDAKFQEPLLENEQVTKQLSVRTKYLQEKQTELEAELEKLRHEQPEDRLYRRASKMIELGAGIEEVIAECELPRAEAELLFSINLKSQL